MTTKDCGISLVHSFVLELEGLAETVYGHVFLFSLLPSDFNIAALSYTKN